MKICKLKLKNLNSFREPVEVNFENPPLDDASLVAITGPTGAGKTTLLDAICVALYGKTPRLSGTGSQNPNYLISHGEKEGFAEVLFMANGIRYLATWSAKQKGSPKVALFYADDDKLITDKLSTRGKSLGSSQKTVSEEVESILGLDFDAFRRSVMLAQGEFAAFLKANDEKRRMILEATAGISIYDVLKRTLNDKVNEVEAVNAAVVDALNKIPEASREQLSEAETVFDRLQSEADALSAQSQQIQNKKQREEERKKDFEKFQSSEERQDELANQQPEIDVHLTTLENANRAQRLLPEKQAYDTAKSELEDAEKVLHVATEERTEAEAQVETDQTIYAEKETAYQTASEEQGRKMPLYRDAKLDVARASDQFDEANKRATALADLDKQIDTLSTQLNGRQTEQSQLQEKIQAAQTFLDDNPLPLNRQQRFTQATGLLTQLGLQEKQLETESTSRTQHKEKVSALELNIGDLSETHREHLTKKEQATAILENADAELNNLLATGTREEWTDRKQQAIEVQPVAQKYEAVKGDLTSSENHVDELSETEAELDAKLVQISAKLAGQMEVCQRTADRVEYCEEARESALLADPIHKLRQRLQAGEPCPVCGATEHSYPDVMEPESEYLLQDAESALEHAEAEAQTAQDQMQALKTKQTQIEQNKHNTAKQIEEYTTEIEEQRNEMTLLLAEWQEIYPDTDVSSDWIAGQVAGADTTIADIVEAEQADIQAKHACETATQLLETCKSNIESENQSLNEAKDQLQNVSSAVEDLSGDIAATKSRFWELLPKTFHGVAPKAAVKQFEEKIEEVAKYQDELNSAEAELKLLNAKIETDQNSLETLRKDRKELQAEIDNYRHEGETYLDAVRDKTGGLETEDEINSAIDALEAGLKAKENARDEAQQRLQKSRELLTQKQTVHEIGETQFKASAEKLETACSAYAGRLSEAGFDSPEAHDDAFRDEEQVQELTNQIDAHEDEKQQLEVEITKLRTRFEETPFDPEALGRIEAQVKEIGEQLQAAQQEVGAQQQKIDDLKDALEKREALGTEISEADQELKRWKRLQDTIPRNDLRDFALEIMFKQMGSIANVQLSYLTSERYQLKVEGIGDLTVIDRWNANDQRPVETLSGGESFLTSLALALALSELSRGRAQLNSLFLDEGFGTLDTETLDIAIAALEGLRMQGRSIFLISHIQELTRRLPVKINVKKQGNGSSSVDIPD